MYVYIPIYIYVYIYIYILYIYLYLSPYIHIYIYIKSGGPRPGASSRGRRPASCKTWEEFGIPDLRVRTKVCMRSLTGWPRLGWLKI